ncbi:VIT family protein [Micrococcales bacterium 31B]|nr:VIT family protein [Micrococcales bacterium 31B]
MSIIDASLVPSPTVSAAVPATVVEPAGASARTLNTLRAGILGANDGILSIAGLVLGVAGASESAAPALLAGVAGLVAGAVSMALGEYVSVASGRDSEKHTIRTVTRALAAQPAAQLDRLAAAYRERGLSPETAALVARELTERDAVQAHLDAEYSIDADELTSPLHAAFSSALAFLVGGVLPLLSIMLAPHDLRAPITYGVVLVALAVTGLVGAKIGGGSLVKAALRVVIGGGLGLALTYVVGALFGAHIA